MASNDFKRLPGFRDFPPEDFALRDHVFGAWRRAAGRYGFLEYDGPPLEALDLYVEKSGEEIVGRLYNFTDKGGRDVSLRPEMTPSLARILGERSRGMPKPIRWFSIPQLFRYERQQRGRLREHYQWNVDIVGEDGVGADAEVLAVAIEGLCALGLGSDDFRARVSDRRLLTALLGALGVEEERRGAAFAIIDKIERTPEEKTRQRFVDEVGLSGAQADRVMDVVRGATLESLGADFGDDETVTEALKPLREYVARLEAMGFGAFVRIDLGIVRGLAYYTGIVFELFDVGRELRAICGGGRYDRLLELVGGDPLPAVGFGMGDVVLGELLADRKLVPEYRRSIDFFLVVVDDAQRPDALRLATRLRAEGRSVSYALGGASVRKQFKSAETEGAGHVVVLGPDEAAEGVVVVRDMSTGQERRVAPEDVA